MASLVKQASNLVATIGQRKEREERAKEIRSLTLSLTRINEKMHAAIREYTFLQMVDDASSLAEIHSEVMDRYRGIRDAMLDLWGENPEQIEILETSDLTNALEGLDRDLQAHAEQVKKVLNGVFSQVSGDHELARTISRVIPDLSIDLSQIRTAYDFFSQHGGGSYNKFQAWVKQPGDLSTRAHLWREHLDRVQQEHNKMNLDAIDTVSEVTRDLLKSLISHRRYKFDHLSPCSIEELRTVFPELSKRLVVKVDDS